MTFRSVVLTCFVSTLACLLGSVSLLAQEKTQQTKTLRFPLPNKQPYVGQIDSLQADGAIKISPTALIRGRASAPLKKGFYLGLAMKMNEGRPQGWEGAKIFRVEVTQVAESAATCSVGRKAAAALGKGQMVFLFQPDGATPAQLKAIPQLAPVRQGGQAGDAGRMAAHIARSQNNLKQIGLAFHNYHDVYKTFPPAVIYGPDGKPWHSWRVLILPFIEQSDLYDRYRFDEPWNGPNNKKLLAAVPPVYRDPVYGERMDHYTHYAAPVGKGTGFPAVGNKTDGKGKDIHKRGPGSRPLAFFRDGSSNSLLVGSVSPGRKIPWTKPEDVPVDKVDPMQGNLAGFAAPYKSAKGSAGIFLRADGSVFALLDSADKTEFRKMLTISDGFPIDPAKLPSFTGASLRPGPPVLEIRQTKEGAVAELK